MRSVKKIIEHRCTYDVEVHGMMHMTTFIRLLFDVKISP